MSLMQWLARTERAVQPKESFWIFCKVREEECGITQVWVVWRLGGTHWGDCDRDNGSSASSVSLVSPLHVLSSVLYPSSFAIS